MVAGFATGGKVAGLGAGGRSCILGTVALAAFTVECLMEEAEQVRPLPTSLPEHPLISQAKLVLTCIRWNPRSQSQGPVGA